MAEELLAAQSHPRKNWYAPAIWGRPLALGYSLSQLTVIGPYPTWSFFKNLLDAGMRPRNIRLVVDDSWQQSEIEKIKQSLLSQRVRIDIRYASSRGLVHAKLYLTHWKNSSNGRSIQLLGWGSPNASSSGFGINAEALSITRLPTTGEGHEASRSIVRYFDAFAAPRGEVEALDCTLRGGIKLLLPSLSFKSDPTPNSFDSWLQAGRLCHHYEPEQGLGKFTVELKQPLPSEVDRVLVKSRLKQENTSRLLRYSYIDSLKGKQERQPPWRSKFFIETWLGHWTSQDCYAMHHTAFYSTNRQARSALLKSIHNSSKSTREDWIRQWLTNLEQLWRGLDQIGRPPSSFLKMRNGSLDIPHYTKRACTQLERHLDRIGQSTFTERFIAGYVFPPVPSLRITPDVGEYSFQELAVDFCNSLIGGITKKRVRSLLALRIRDTVTKDELLELDGEGLYKHLSDHWDRLGKNIRAFHERVE